MGLDAGRSTPFRFRESYGLPRVRASSREQIDGEPGLLASQQRETHKDLQLTAAVQRLLLPRRDTIVTESVELSGFSLPANDAGGDWWSAEAFGDGRARIMAGDVTGHGVAPAMVAAVVAGAYRGLREIERRDARAVLELLHSVLVDVCAGRCTMPFGLLDVFPDGRATWLSAASPPPS